MLIKESPANLLDVFGFDSIKANWIDSTLNLGKCESVHPRRIRRESEQTATGTLCCLVFCSEAEEAGDENQKWIVGLFRNCSQH